MDLIIVDMLPYSIVEGEAFKRLNLNDPLLPRRYKAKSEKYFRTTLMPNTYERVKAKVKNVLKEAEYISFTTDIWSNPSKSCSLLSFTAHFVKEAVRHKIVLAASVLDLDHTGEYMAQKLTDTLLTWDIESKIHIGVRDNAANMVSAMRKANIDDFGCMAHTLQLVIPGFYIYPRSRGDNCKKTRKIVGHFKHSEQACRHLTHYQNCLKVPNHCMIQDVGTRWNSTFLMLQRAAEQRMAINLYSLERKGIDTLSNTEWEHLERVVLVLKPFYDATFDICLEDASISIAIPIVAMIMGKLQSDDPDVGEGLVQMRAALRDAMLRRFSHLKKMPYLCAATLLDPRFKKFYFTSEETDFAKTEVLRFLRSRVNADDEVNSTEVSSSLPGSSHSPPSRSKQGSGLWDAHDASFRTSLEEPSDCDPRPADEVQLDLYLKEARVSRSSNIFQYWHCSSYPLLEPAAHKHLSAPPTSVASERLFSTAGQLYADRRSKLLGENAEKLLFLSYNIRLFDFDY